MIPTPESELEALVPLFPRASDPVAQAKGLETGAGAPSEGMWRLALTSGLDIRVTAFVRHADGS